MFSDKEIKIWGGIYSRIDTALLLIRGNEVSGINHVYLENRDEKKLGKSNDVFYKYSRIPCKFFNYGYFYHSQQL